MIQLKTGVSGSSPVVFLDLYDEDLPKLTLSIEDITTSETTTTFSRQFRLPATTNNTQFFQTAFNVNGYDFDISVKKSAEILIDGSLFKVGEIRLQQVYLNETGNSVDYGVIFLGDVRDFASSVGEGPLCALDFTEFTHTRTLANVTASWDAYPETGPELNEGLFSGSIVYPLVDFGNSYNDSRIAQQTKISAIGTSTSGKFVFNNPSDWLNTDRLRPCIKAKDIWDKIFENAGYTYNSVFLDSNLFRHLYIGAWGDEAVVSLGGLETAYPTDNRTIYINGSSRLAIGASTNDDSVNWDFDLFTWTAPDLNPASSQIKVGVNVFFDNDIPAQEVDIEIRLRYSANGTGPATTLQTETWNITSTLSEFPEPYVPDSYLESEQYQFGVTLSPSNVGDIYWVEVENKSTSDQQISVIGQTSFWQVTTNPSLNVGSSLSCEMTQLEFIKAIINKFKLVMAPDKVNPENFIIEPWQSYIGSGDLFDWTTKLDYNKDVVLTPLLYTQKDRITFTDTLGDDFLNNINNDNFSEVYGTLYLNASSNVVKGEREIENKFIPCISTQIEDSEQALYGMDNTIIPQIHDHEAVVNSAGTPYILHNPVNPGVRLFWYDGFKHTGTDGLGAYDDAWYLTDGATTDNFTKFPMISQFNEWGDRDDAWQGLDTLTRDLSWQRENTFIKYDLASVDLGNSIYDLYWSSYIDTLYDPFSRRFTAYFILDTYDLQNFSFDDVIFVRDAYYYVEKIHDVVVGKKSSVKVDLIKIQTFVPPTSGFIPPGLYWEDITDNWEAITDNWEDV